MDNSPTGSLRSQRLGRGGLGISEHAGSTMVSADEVLAMLRMDGGRVTEARKAVVETLLAAGDEHITADELATRVQRRHPEVHRSTVYRTLERLESNGIVTHVHLGHGPSTFHLAHRPHHHAVCSSCSAVVELTPTALDGVAEELRQKYGWELSHQHFALSALCDNCL